MTALALHDAQNGGPRVLPTPAQPMTPQTDDLWSAMSRDVAELRKTIADRGRETDDAFNHALARVTDQNRESWHQMMDRYIELSNAIARLQEGRQTEARMTEERLRTSAYYTTWVSIGISTLISALALWLGNK